jgi:hypothetical protein
MQHISAATIGALPASSSRFMKHEVFAGYVKAFSDYQLYRL